MPRVRDLIWVCLLYTSDAADDGVGVDLGDNETMEELQEEIINYLENN